MDPQGEAVGTVKPGDYTLRARAKRTNAVVYGCVRSGKGPWKKPPVFPDTVCADLRTSLVIHDIFLSQKDISEVQQNVKPQTAQSRTLEYMFRELPILENSKEEAKRILRREDFMKRSHCRLFISLWMFT